mmetsp:Transcript_27031/g.44377  ORF Transcript_27031/g.44377 Transcript_27031/m.44377 type:complete len:344 (+) Transcript_27031:292-1323(+)
MLNRLFFNVSQHPQTSHLIEKPDKREILRETPTTKWLRIDDKTQLFDFHQNSVHCQQRCKHLNNIARNRKNDIQHGLESTRSAFGRVFYIRKRVFQHQYHSTRDLGQCLLPIHHCCAYNLNRWQIPQNGERGQITQLQRNGLGLHVSGLATRCSIRHNERVHHNVDQEQVTKQDGLTDRHHQRQHRRPLRTIRALRCHPNRLGDKIAIECARKRHGQKHETSEFSRHQFLIHIIARVAIIIIGGFLSQRNLELVVQLQRSVDAHIRCVAIHRQHQFRVILAFTMSTTTIIIRQQHFSAVRRTIVAVALFPKCVVEVVNTAQCTVLVVLIGYQWTLGGVQNGPQ